MRSAYRYLAHAFPALVVIQAMAIATALFGLLKYTDKHALPKSPEDANLNFAGEVGFEVHHIVGMNIVPLVALALLIVSFFAKVPGGVKWAAFIFLAVIVQVLLAFVSFGVPYVGALHVLNAFVLIGLGLVAGRAAKGAEAEAPAVPAAATA